MPRARLAAAVLAALLALPAVAQAKDVYVDGAGTASDSCLDAASACTLDKALTSVAVNGDTVIVDGAAGPIVLGDRTASNQAILIRSSGTEAARPVVTGAPLLPDAPLLELNAPGAAISGLDVRNTALPGLAGPAVMLRGEGAVLQDSVVSSAGTALLSGQSAPVVRRVIVRGGTGGADLAASETAPATIANSVITTTAADAVGLLNQNLGEVLAVNVTVLSPGATATGVRANAAAIGGLAGSQITVRNAIVRGGDGDLTAGVAGVCAPACGNGVVRVDHSHFLTLAGPVSQGAGNVGGDPIFVSATDLHLQAASPLRDRGIVDPLSETVDLDGAPRTDGPAPDLGAYEYLIPLPPRNPAPDLGPAVAPADTSAPTLGVIRLSRSRFRVGSQATALSAARRRAPAGTIVTTGVTERSTVLFEIDRLVTGRRSGGDCVKAPAKTVRRLKAGARCRLALPVEPGLERVAARPGRLSFPFSGRIGTRALPAGPYRMVVTATDAAGNRSAPQSTAFTILAPAKAPRPR